jgi:hypothetical protein
MLVARVSESRGDDSSAVFQAAVLPLHPFQPSCEGIHCWFVHGSLLRRLTHLMLRPFRIKIPIRRIQYVIKAKPINIIETANRLNHFGKTRWN